jgi:urease accessory protein
LNSPLRAIKYTSAGALTGLVFDKLVLDAQDRHVRRKLLATQGGHEILIDLPRPVYCADGDHLELEDGRLIQVVAALEDLYDVRGTSPSHMVSLAWQLGNRHLPAQLEWDRILIKRDPIIKDMLLKLQATVTEIRDRFDPAQGAYAAHGPFGHDH